MKRSAFIYLLFLAVPVILHGQPDSILINQYELEGVVISADKRESGIMDVPLLNDFKNP